MEGSVESVQAAPCPNVNGWQEDVFGKDTIKSMLKAVHKILFNIIQLYRFCGQNAFPDLVSVIEICHKLSFSDLLPADSY